MQNRTKKKKEEVMRSMRTRRRRTRRWEGDHSAVLLIQPCVCCIASHSQTAACSCVTYRFTALIYGQSDTRTQSINRLLTTRRAYRYCVTVTDKPSIVTRFTLLSARSTRWTDRAGKWENSKWRLVLLGYTLTVYRIWGGKLVLISDNHWPALTE